MCEHLVDAYKRIERETAARIATLEQLRHADRLMTVGKLASGIAHELGTPLNVISARAEMIASGDATPAEAKDYARIIGEASHRMAKIIRQLLAFARRKPADKAPRDVHRLASEVLELLRPLAEKKNAQLNLDCRCPEPEAIATVDGAEIQQAMTNLVVNAMQAMPRGGTIRRIHRPRIGPAAALGPRDAVPVRPGPGPRRRNLSGRPAPRLRAVLHDQGRRRRDRPRALRDARNHPGSRGLDRRGERGQEGDPVLHLPADRNRFVTVELGSPAAPAMSALPAPSSTEPARSPLARAVVVLHHGPDEVLGRTLCLCIARGRVTRIVQECGGVAAACVYQMYLHDDLGELTRSRSVQSTPHADPSRRSPVPRRTNAPPGVAREA